MRLKKAVLAEAIEMAIEGAVDHLIDTPVALTPGNLCLYKRHWRIDDWDTLFEVLAERLQVAPSEVARLGSDRTVQAKFVSPDGLTLYSQTDTEGRHVLLIGRPGWVET